MACAIKGGLEVLRRTYSSECVAMDTIIVAPHPRPAPLLTLVVAIHFHTSTYCGVASTVREIASILLPWQCAFAKQGDLQGVIPE